MDEFDSLLDSLSVRDQFAIGALQGLLAMQDPTIPLPDSCSVTEKAYELADAMLAAR